MPAIPTARQAAELLVQRLRTVDADGRHQPADPALERRVDERDGLVAKPSRRRKVEQEERSAALLDGRDDVVQIAAHEQLAARHVHPAELRPAREEPRDLVRRHLVHALLLPDVAHLTAEVAVVGGDERDLVRQRRRLQVRPENRGAESSLFDEHSGRRTLQRPALKKRTTKDIGCLVTSVVKPTPGVSFTGSD